MFCELSARSQLRREQRKHRDPQALFTQARNLQMHFVANRQGVPTVRDQVHQLLRNAHMQRERSLGAEAVRIAQLAAALHAAQAAERIANNTSAREQRSLQEQFK